MYETWLTRDILDKPIIRYLRHTRISQVFLDLDNYVDHIDNDISKAKYLKGMTLKIETQLNWN